jgi:hypothetical protein
MRHPLVTAAAIAGVMVVIGPRSTPHCAPEHELVCAPGGVTDLSARREAKPRKLKFRKHAARQQSARRHRAKVRAAQYRAKAKLLRRNGARGTVVARRSSGRVAGPPATPLTAQEIAAIKAAPEFAIKPPLPIARRLAETFDTIYDPRRLELDDSLSALAQVSSADSTETVDVPAPEPGETVQMDGPPAVDPFQVMPLIAFGVLGGAFMAGMAIDSVRRRRPRRRRKVRKDRWQVAKDEAELDALPTWMSTRQGEIGPPSSVTRRRTSFRRRIWAIRPSRPHAQPFGNLQTVS